MSEKKNVVASVLARLRNTSKSRMQCRITRRFLRIGSVAFEKSL